MSMKTGTGPICIISTLISLSFMLRRSAQGHPDPRILVIKKRKERKVKSLSRSCREKHFVVLKCQSLIPQVGQCLPVAELNVSLGKKGPHWDAKEMISWVSFPPREEKITPSVCTQLLTSQMLFSSVIFLSSLKIKAEDTAIGKVVEETQQTHTSAIIPIFQMSTWRPRAHKVHARDPTEPDPELGPNVFEGWDWGEVRMSSPYSWGQNHFICLNISVQTGKWTMFLFKIASWSLEQEPENYGL